MWAAYHRVDTGSYSPGKFLCKTSGTSEQTGRSFRVTLWRKFSMQQFKIRSPGERWALSEATWWAPPFKGETRLQWIADCHGRTLCLCPEEISLSLPIWCAMVLNKAATSDYHPSVSTGRVPCKSASRSWVWIQTPSGLRTLSNACSVRAVKETLSLRSKRNRWDLYAPATTYRSLVSWSPL